MTDRTVAITPGSGDQVAFDDNSQIVKMVWGATGTHTKVEDGAGKRLPVNLAEINVTVPVSGTFWQATQPISASALPLPSGAATAAKQPALGTAGTPSADVISVQGVSGGTAVPVSGTFWQTTQPVSGPLTDTQLRASAVPVSGTVTIQDGGGSITVDGTFWQATQPVSIAATVTVDSELPAAALLADTANAIPTAPMVGAALMVSNGTTLDLVRTGASDGAASSQKVPAITFGFNGSTFDRARTVTATMDQAATGIMAAGIVAQLDDTSTQTVTENQFGVVRMTSARALHANLAQVAGSTVSTAATGVQKVGVVGNGGASVDGVVTAASAPANGVMGLGIYNSTEPSPTTGQSVGIQLDAKGRTRTVLMDAAGNTRGANVDASNRLSVTIDAFTATNASVNVAQMNGVATSMGAGAVGTGVQRVTWCSDSPANVVDNAGFTDGTTGLLMAGHIFDETAGTALTENDAAASRIDSKRAQVMVVEDATTRGQRQAVSAAGGASIAFQTPTTASLTGASINASSSGDNTIVSGTASQTVRVHRLFLVVAAACTLKFKDGAGTDLTGAMTLNAGGAIMLDLSTDPWFVTSSGNGFVINLSAAVQCSGRVYYTKS